MIYSKFPFNPDLTFKGNTCLLVWKIAAGSFLMKSVKYEKSDSEQIFHML